MLPPSLRPLLQEGPDYGELRAGLVAEAVVDGVRAGSPLRRPHDDVDVGHASRLDSAEVARNNGLVRHGVALSLAGIRRDVRHPGRQLFANGHVPDASV